jgi:hypothetical protein
MAAARGRSKQARLVGVAAFVMLNLALLAALLPASASASASASRGAAKAQSPGQKARDHKDAAFVWRGLLQAMTIGTGAWSGGF